MDNVEIAYRNNRDRAIRRNHGKFIFQFHLLPPLMDMLLTIGVLILPHEARKLLDEFLIDEIKVKCGGDGLRCVAYEPHQMYTEVLVKYVGENWTLVAPWRVMFRVCNVKEMAVMSIWGYYEEGLPRFIFRLDGYAEEGEDLPLLTDLNVVDEIEETEESKEEADNVRCLCSCCPIM